MAEKMAEKMADWLTDTLPTFPENLHILVVDYDRVYLNDLVLSLLKESYKVTKTHLASVALSIVEKKGDEIDLVMTNSRMLDMDSYTYLHLLVMKNIAVILLTSPMSLTVAEKALEEGACYLLQKPVSKEDLKCIWQYIYQRNKNLIKKNHQKSQINVNNSSPSSKRAKCSEIARLERTCVRSHLNDHIATNKAGPKLVLKMIKEPYLTPPQVARHRQKNKAQVECAQTNQENLLPSMQAPRSDFSTRTQCQPLLGNEQHVSSVVAGDRFQPIAPTTLSSPTLSDTDLVNHSLGMLNHNVHSKDVGVCLDNNEKFIEEESIFHNDNWGKFAVGDGVQASNLNLPNVSKMTPEIASSEIFDNIQFPDNTFDVIQQQAFDIRNQEATERSGTIEANQSMPGDDVVGQELPVGSINEVSQPLSEYVNLSNKPEDDSFNCDSYINMSEVDKYNEQQTDPESFISSDAEKVPIEDTQYDNFLADAFFWDDDQNQAFFWLGDQN